MSLRALHSESPDLFPLPAAIRAKYGPFGFFPTPDDRPYVTSNFVMGLDGIASFRELPGRVGGVDVSRSADDRWLMDFYRAHHDAQIIGANTVKEEQGLDVRGWDYRIDDSELLRYRRDVLKLPKQNDAPPPRRRHRNAALRGRSDGERHDSGAWGRGRLARKPMKTPNAAGTAAPPGAAGAALNPAYMLK